jgi:hypothetical protein
MKFSGLFQVMAGALALGLAGCGQTQQPNPLLTVRPDAFGGTGGETTLGVVGWVVDTPSQPFSSALTEIAPSDGCGKPVESQSGGKVTIQTSGVKAPDCADRALDGTRVCNAWATPRDYYVYLPANYDPNKAYPLVFDAPGCGGNGTNIYPINDNHSIRVGLTPGPNSTGHGTNPEQGCFDDKEGDDSIDWAYYENVYDRLNAELCFDRNRVFAGGNSSGAWLANELGCKYAGDPIRPLRAVLPNSGGLPTEPLYLPTCSAAPLAGMWVHDVANTTTPFSSELVAIERAMALAQCESGSYDTAVLQNFPIGGGNSDDTCQRISRCDPRYPLVVCALPGASRGSHDNVVVPGWSTFIKLFEAPPLLTQ